MVAEEVNNVMRAPQILVSVTFEHYLRLLNGTYLLSVIRDTIIGTMTFLRTGTTSSYDVLTVIEALHQLFQSRLWTHSGRSRLVSVGHLCISLMLAIADGKRRQHRLDKGKDGGDSNAIETILHIACDSIVD